MARASFLPLPAAAKELPINLGFEAVGVAPALSPLSGALVAIAEQPNGTAPDGFLIGGPTPGMFSVRRSDGYDVTDLAFLPEGDLLILERRYSLLTGIGMRIRRIAAADLRPGAVLDGEVVVEAGPDTHIDNMEALAVSRGADGETLLTLMSDDNFSVLQRTVLLRFALIEELE
jgi:hypothetical protein